MKKTLTAVLLIFALLLTMVGCSAANAAAHLDAAEDRVENKLDAVEDSVERAIRDAMSNAPAQPAPTEAAPAETAPAAPAATTTPEPITKEGAEKIALDYLGLAADQVKRLHTEYEIDDGISQYDVQFISGDWEYEFEIHAENGRILSYDKDHKYD